MRADAKVAVIGGGIAGCSVLYHLTRLGWEDAVLLEKHELTGGSTWHAAGLLTQFSPSYNLMTLLRSSVDLYRSLGEITGEPVDLHICGSVRLATSQDRIDEFHHVAGVAQMVGVPYELISVERVRELFPLLEPDGVLAAAHLPSDGWVDPASMANALARAARAAGAEIARRTPVTHIERRGDGWVLETPRGTLHAGVVVNAAGIWAPEIGRLINVELPIIPLQHHYVLTEDLPELATREFELPVLRDPDRSFYARQDGAALLVGPFERGAKSWAAEGIPKNFHNRLLQPDLKRIADALEAAGDRIPAFAAAGIKRVINGPDGYTPDGRALMGPVPGAKNFHVLAGFSIFGIVFGGGAGKYAAEWIVDGQPSDNMWELDVRRFGEYARSRAYVSARASEVYEREYAIHFPEEERPAGRPLKTSPLYEPLRSRGAVYGARFGWERPLWFSRGDGDEYSFRRGNWHATVGDECHAVRSRVGVLDQTSFAKYELSGRGAEKALDRLCANVLPDGSGKIVLTQMCTEQGGIECDVTVTRLAEDHFYIVSAAATELHDFDWIARNIREDLSVTLENVSDRYGVLTLAGPNSRDLLRAATDVDCSDHTFPFFSYRALEIGPVPVRALRLSYVGELGYELHHPIEFAARLYARLLEVGADLGLVDFGYRALESMRLEKAYRLWGADMSADYTPFEAGLARFVRLDKDSFIGRDALLRQQEEGWTRQLSCLVIESQDADPHGYEPVLAGDTPIGYVASGGYGHTVGATIALAYLPTEYGDPGTEVSVSILGSPCPAVVVREPLYDPENTRLFA